MRTIILALTLTAAVGCRNRATMDDERPTSAKPVQHDDDFIQTRTTFETSMRERLARIDKRLDQLDTRTDASGHGTAVKLRARRKAVADQLKQADNQAEAGWDRYEQDLTSTVDALEHDLDQLVY